MGKGQRAAFDDRLNAELERMNKELGYYPSLRQIIEQLNDGSTVTNVYTSLKRLIKNKKISKTAAHIYGVKHENKKASRIK